MGRFDIEAGPLQVVVDDRAQDRSGVRHAHEWFTHQVLGIDGFERGETVVARQHHHQRLLDEKAVRQVWHPVFPSKKSRIELSFRKGIGEQRRVLTGYHHIDVRQCVVQDLQGFGHPPQFVPGQKAHGEAGLGGMSGPARRVGCRFNLRQHRAGVFEKGSTRRRQFDAACAARQKCGTNLFLKIADLPAQGRL